MRSFLAVSIDQNEFLNSFTGTDFAGIQVPHRIHRDRVNDVELPGHRAVVAYRADGSARHPIVNPNLVVIPIRNQHILLFGVVREGDIVGVSAIDGNSASSTLYP